MQEGKKTDSGLLNQSQFAERQGVTSQTINRLVGLGILTVVDGKLDPATADAEFEARPKRGRNNKAPKGAGEKLKRKYKTHKIVVAVVPTGPEGQSLKESSLEDVELPPGRVERLPPNKPEKDELSSPEVCLRVSLHALDRLIYAHEERVTALKQARSVLAEGSPA